MKELNQSAILAKKDTCAMEQLLRNSLLVNNGITEKNVLPATIAPKAPMNLLRAPQVTFNKLL